jgi:hypothetical protein
MVEIEHIQDIEVEENKTRQSVDSTIKFIRNRFSNSTSTMELKTAA